MESHTALLAPAKWATGRSAMVATAFPAATDIAVDILGRGGNAVDAAVAAAWALSVCEPSGSGLGGQAILMVHSPTLGDVVLDGHSHGPQGLTRKQVDRAQQRKGFRACTIPSMPATVGAAHAKFGRLPLAETLAPSVQLAEEGIPVSKLLRRHIQWCERSLSASEATARTFLPGGRPPKRRQVLRQPELAETLRRLQQHGIDDFYRGGIARDIVDDHAMHGGLIDAHDLAELGLPVFRKPVEIQYRGRTVSSTPPPGGGLQLLLGLKVVEALGLDGGAADDEWHEGMAAIVQAIFRERSDWPVHPDKISGSMMNWLLSEARAEEVADKIRQRAVPVVRASEGPGDTTHLCVVDGDGMVVSLTQSIQSLFGAKVMNERLGFFYNNYLTTCPRYRHPSRLRRNAMPQSNAAPTIVFEGDGADRRPVLIVGSAGSRRITSSILHTITNVLDRGMSLFDALDAPRVHATLSGRPMVEKRAATPELLTRLEARFRPARIKAERSYSMGAVQAIASSQDGWVGAADPRREGTASGF
ncbi:MAG: gamma-glutamyltransferase [Candidatus Eisenbacteria bacterium]